MPIAEGIAAAKLALDATKAALDLLRYPKIDGEQVRNKLIEMQDLIFNAQRELGNAEDDNRELKRQLADLQEKQKLNDSLVFVENVYWKEIPPDALDGPFCTTCWHQDQRLARLAFVEEGTYRNFNSGNAPRLMREYRCTIHDNEKSLIPADLFVHVKVQWARPRVGPTTTP